MILPAILLSHLPIQPPIAKAEETTPSLSLGASTTQPPPPEETGLEFFVDSSTKVSVHGYAHVDYGNGDRYGDAAGEDQLGVTQAALETVVEHGSVKFVSVIGGTLRSSVPNDIGFKDLFVVWDQVGGGDLKIRAGAQATLFGLKPAGYPGDRTINPSVEFGAGGTFASSNQAGPSIILEHPLGELGRIEAGIFDTDATTAGTGGSLDGSGAFKNYFVQLRFEDVGVEGLYGSAGYEGLYLGQTSGGAAIDSTESIFSVGLGYSTDLVDASIELVQLDQRITETADDESYLVGELAFFPADRVSVLLDYSDASEAGIQTYRVGTIFDYNEFVSFHLEYAHDALDVGPDVDSVEARMSFGF